MKKTDKYTVWMLCLGVTALAIRVAFALLDIRTIVTFIPDDSFYYFQLASKFIQGYGPSIDGVNVTNGFHPLWVLVISPFFVLKSLDPVLPVRLTLILSGIFSIATAYVLNRIIVVLTENKALGLFAFAAYLFTIHIFLTDMYGEPTGISNFLVVCVVLVTARIAVSGEMTARGAIIAGVVGGLAMLARTENVLFIAPLFVFILFWGPERRKYYYFVFACIAAFILVLPWLLWSYVTFGTIVQTSMGACPYIYRYPVQGGPDPTLSSIIHYLSEVFGATYDLRFLFKYSPIHYLFPFLWGALIVGLFRKDVREKRSVILVYALSIAVLVIYGTHAFVGYVREWHLTAMAFVAVLVTALFISLYFGDRKTFGKTAVIVNVAYFGLATAFGAVEIVYPDYTWQTEMYDAAEYINEHPEHKFAVYDGGIVGYFTDGRILPIDGNVNPAAHEAVKEKRVYDYMKEEGADYIIGCVIANNAHYRPFWPYRFDEMFEEVPNDLDNPENTKYYYSVYKLIK